MRKHSSRRPWNGGYRDLRKRGARGSGRERSARRGPGGRTSLGIRCGRSLRRRPSSGRSPISRSAMRCLRRPTLLAAALAHGPGDASIGAVERAVEGLKREGRVHEAPALKGGGGLTTDKAVARERETITLMRAGSGRGKAAMRGWMVERHLRKGPLTAGQKQAVKLILSEKDRTVGVQGYAGAGKTRMLGRARTLAAKKGWRVLGLAPSASAVRTLEAESGIKSETLQRFLARNEGLAEGRLTKSAAKKMRAAFAKTVLVVDEGSLASTAQARDLLRIAGALRIPKLVLVGDAKQLEAVDAGKPFAQLQARHEDRDDGRDPPPARSRSQGRGRGEHRGRYRARF